jgi:hypothetical protein
LSARLAPDLSPGVSSFLTASPSGPAVPLHEMAPSTSSDRLGAASERRAPSPPNDSPGRAGGSGRRPSACAIAFGAGGAAR